MSQIGVSVITSTTPAAVQNAGNTANAFMVGLADWGPVGASGVTTPATSLSQAAALIGPPNGGLTQTSRTATDATLYDSADAFFREGGSTVYIARVTGPSPTKGTLTLRDSAGASVALLTGAYPGSGSSAINVSIATNGSAAYTVTVQDTAANVLAISPTLTNVSGSARTDLISWAAGTNLFTASPSATACIPASTVAVGSAFSAGTDDRANASVSNWSTALNNGFGFGLGPGQVMAPATTNTALPGIWSALANHAVANNRIALLDGTDGNSATSAIAEVTTAALPSSVQGYCGIWTGNLQIPGITSGTVRVIAPSPVVAALCARADNRGNPNQAAAGTGFPLQYVSAINTVYSNPLTGDISNLNSNGINVFSVQFGTLQNFGFVSALGVPTADLIYWQLNHGRTRMSIVNAAQFVASPFTFSQVDGQGQTLAAFGGAMSGMLLGYYSSGALYGQSSSDAYTVDVGPSVNTTSTLSAGTLTANIAVRMSPFAQLVQIIINAVPITQNLVQPAA